MSAVLEAVHRIGGEIDLKTIPGVGTQFRLMLPLSVAITNALLVDVDGETFALPVATIAETIELDGGLDTEVEWRGERVPAIDLGDAMKTVDTSRRTERRFAAVVETERRLCALAVDGFGEIEEVVVRPLDEVFGAPRGLGGSSLLADGRMVLILDPTTLTGSKAPVRRSA